MKDKNEKPEGIEENKKADHDESEHDCDCGEHKIPRILDILLVIIGFACAVIGLIFRIRGGVFYPNLLFIGAYLAFGVPVFYGLIMDLLEGEFFSEDMLMTIASVGSIVIGESLEGMLVMLLFRIGEYLEEYAEGRAEKNIKELMKLKPKTVRKKTQDGKFTVSAPEHLVPGDIIIIRPGEIIGADGTVVSGSGEINTSSITGESLPVSVSEGSDVLFGYINTNGLLEVRVTHAYADGTFAKILRTMEENLEKKSKSETFIKKFAKVYTPCVMIISLLLFLIGGLTTGNYGIWLYRALLFLAVSCPCALVISVPLTFFVGLGFLSKAGLLLKGSAFVEKLAKCGIAAFDKTGTLTDGKLTVVGVEAGSGYTPEEVVTLAYMLEKGSNHPVARAIIEEAGKYELPNADTAELEEISGRGMSAVIEGEKVWCGNVAILELAGVSRFVSDAEFSGVYVVKGSRIVGRIFVADNIRSGSASLFSGLRERKINTAVLTGDRGATAEKCRKALSPNLFFSGLLPHEKSENLEKIMSRNAKDVTTVYLGDGINDAPVMALADVGIAMGIDGADVTIETADGILMNDKPETLLRAIDMSKRIVKRATANVVFALAVKLAVLILGAFGFANMLTAVFADVGVLIIVVLNSLRGYKFK